MKKLLTALGTGSKDKNGKLTYRDTVYKYDDRYYYTSYISKVLLKELDYDEIVYIGTATSGWDNLFDYFGKEILEEEKWCEGLEKIEDAITTETTTSEFLKDLISPVIQSYVEKEFGKKIMVSFAIMDIGITNEEINNNLKLFVNFSENSLNTGENIEIDIDITHSFRSLPFIYDVMLRYIYALDKNDKIKLGNVFYGMLEVSRLSEVIIKSLKTNSSENKQFLYSEEEFSKISSEYDKPSVIVNLNNLHEVNDWILAVNEFIKFGYSKSVVKLLKEYSEKKNIEIYTAIADKLNELSYYISANNINKVHQYLVDIHKLLKESEKQNDDGFVKPALKLLEDYVRDLKNDKEGILKEIYNFSSKFKNQYKMARYYLSKENYPSFISCLNESLTTLLVDDSNTKDYESRQEIKKEMIKEGNVKLKDGKEFKNMLPQEKLRIFMAVLNTLRNFTMHSYAMNTGDKNFSNYRNNLQKLNLKNENGEIDYASILKLYDEVVSEFIKKGIFGK